MTIESVRDKEGRVIDLYGQGKTYKEIAEELRISPRDISRILKKARGEEEQSNINQDPKEQYSKIYQLFSEGKSPLQVAIALNLPVDYASGQYIEYLKSKRLFSIVQLYQRIGDTGTRTVLSAYNSMEKVGYGNKPELVGRYVRYCEDMVNEGVNLKKMRENSNKAYQETRDAKSEREELNRQNEAARRTLADTNKKIEERSKELARINGAIAYQIKANPFITAAQAGREAAERVLCDRIWLIRTAQDVYLKVIQNNMYVRWLFIPETRPEGFDRFSEKQIVAYCQSAIDAAANEYFYRVLNEATRRTLKL